MELDDTSERTLPVVGTVHEDVAVYAGERARRDRLGDPPSAVNDADLLVVGDGDDVDDALRVADVERRSGRAVFELELGHADSLRHFNTPDVVAPANRSASCTCATETTPDRR